MTKLRDINLLHLCLVLGLTLLGILIWSILILVFEGFLFSSGQNAWTHNLIICLLMTVTYGIFISLLLRNNNNYRLLKPAKANSFKITSILLTVIFCWYIRFSILGILTLDPHGKSQDEKFADDINFIRHFIKHNYVKDHSNGNEIKIMLDSLGGRWELVDTLNP